MSKESIINLGSPENPVLVPKKALLPETAKGREWWQLLAEGSVTLPSENLSRLLEVNDGKKID